MRKTLYLVEVRDALGALDFRKEDELRKVHPYLFSKRTFDIDELCYYVSFDKPAVGASGPTETWAWMAKNGFSCRPKTW